MGSIPAGNVVTIYQTGDEKHLDYCPREEITSGEESTFGDESTSSKESECLPQQTLEVLKTTILGLPGAPVFELRHHFSQASQVAGPH